MDNDSKKTIKYIITQYGTDILYDSKKLSSLIMDLVSINIKERNILKIAISAGIPVKIIKADNCDKTDKDLILSQCKIILSEDYGMEEKWSTFAVNCFAYALDWNEIIVKDLDSILANVVRQMMYDSK